jgi:DNA polymerase III sliding clamp (beta) subunit (PCNA family)
MVTIQVTKKDLTLLQRALVKRSMAAQKLTLQHDNSTVTLSVANADFVIAQSFTTTEQEQEQAAPVQVSADMLRSMLKSHIKCTLTLQDDALLVTDDRMQVLEPTTPAPAANETYQTIGTLSAAKLKVILEKVVMAASTDTVIPIYHHILLVASASGLQATAGGKLMIAEASDSSTTYVDQFNFLLPVAVANLLLDTDIAADIQIQQSANTIQLSWGNNSITYAYTDATAYPTPPQYRTTAITSVSRTALNAAMLRTVLAYADDDQYRIIAIATAGGSVALEAQGARNMSYNIGTTTTTATSMNYISLDTLENIVSTVPNDTLFTIYTTENNEAVIFATSTATYTISTIRGL